MEKQYESPNIDNFSDSDEKSSSRFIPRRVLETSVKQASPSWIDHVRNNGDQVLVDDDTRINVTKCNYLFKTETMNLSGSSTTELSPTELDATEIARSNRSKSALELLQYLQECIQKIDSELKNNEEPKESLDVAMNTISNYISKLDTLRIQKLAKIWLEIRNNLIYGRRNFRKRNSDSTTNSNKSGEESKDYQNKEKENREMSQKIGELPSFRSTNALVKNLEVGKSIDSMTNIHDIAYIPSTSITEDQPETIDNKEYLDPVNSAELISTPKYALVLKSQPSQECIQKIESDNKSKNYEGSYSMESSPAQLSCMDQLNASNCICEQVSKKIDICHGYNEFLLLIFEADFYTNYKVQIPRENNSDSTTETSIEQASPNRTDYIRNNGDQVLANDDTRINVTKCNYLFKTETMNLSGSSTTELSPTELDATEIARSNRSKSALELLQYLQECIQKIESKSKSKEPKKLLDVAMNMILDYISKLDTLRIQKLSEKWLEIRNNLIYGRRNFRKRNSDSTTNSSKSDEESRDYQNKEKENCEMSQKIDELPSFRSTDASVKYLEVEKSIDSMTNIHDISSTSITDDQPETTDNKEYLDPVNSAELISTPKYAHELKSQSLQECIQKIESDKKSKNYEGSYSMESLAESFYMDQLNASNRICELYEHLSKKIYICHVYNQLLFLKFEACFYTDNVQILRKNNSNSTTETSVEQASPSRTDYVSGQILADTNAGTNVTECNYSSETKTLNLPESSTTEPSTTESSPMESSGTESSATEIAQPSTSKSTLELKSQSSQESTQKNDSDNKPKENQDKCQIINTKAEESMDLTADIHDNTSDSPASDCESTDDQAEAMNDEVFVKFLEKFTSTSMSKDKPLQWKCLNVISKFACRILIFLFLILPQLVMMVINKVASKYIITYDKAEKNKKPEYIQDTDIKIRRKKSFTCLKCFIILLILILSLFLFLFLFYFHFRPVYLDEDDMHFDTFATTVVELEKRILDHDATIRVLTEYLERDTPSLKVVALIGDTSVDKPYTVDIIKKRLRKRRRNGPSPSFPTFIVLENLRAEHSKVVINYAKTYQEAYGNREFTILAVFKVEQIDEDLTRADINHVIDTVKDIFIEANIIMKIIPFKPLSEETLEKHIKNTAKNIGQTFSQDQIDYHKRRLIEDDTDRQRKYGC